MLKRAAATLALLVLSATIAPRAAPGLRVVVTFPSLRGDVRLLLGEGDEVLCPIPAGADPHEYQLTPGDLRALAEADLIISTSHTPLELTISRLVEAGELRGELVDVLKIPNMTILENPMTSKPNFHMPIYDPGNYKRFVRYLASRLASARPEKGDWYRARAEAVLREVDRLIESARRLNATAVADMPFAQYAVSWLNVTVRFLVVREWGVPTAPRDLESIEEALRRGEVSLAVVTEPPTAKPSLFLEELAEGFGIPVLYVPSPLAPGSILSKLKEVASGAAKIALSNGWASIGVVDDG